MQLEQAVYGNDGPDTRFENIETMVNELKVREIDDVGRLNDDINFINQELKDKIFLLDSRLNFVENFETKALNIKNDFQRLDQRV